MFIENRFFSEIRISPLVLFKRRCKQLEKREIQDFLEPFNNYQTEHPMVDVLKLMPATSTKET